MFWRVRYALDSDSPFDLYPFKFEPMHADYVFPVFAPGSTKLTEVFVRYQLPSEAARCRVGHVVERTGPTWWNIASTGQARWEACPARSRSQSASRATRKQIKIEQNPFGFVPFVYIPHIPSNGFFGMPLAEWAGAVDLAEEYNERLANIGDIVRQNSYPFGVLKNHPTAKIKSPFRLWKDGPTVVDLGPGPAGRKGA